MNWTVIWLDGPLAELARHYLSGVEAGRADAITEAMARVDRLLDLSPDQQGESRAGNSRVMFDPPLVIDFEVHTDERVAIVTRVRYRPRR